VIGTIAMHIRLHKNARTTPATRAEIAASSDSVATLAARYHVGQGTIRRWRTRSVFTEGSHAAHHLQTTLNSAQELIVVQLRKTLLLPLDDLLAVTREFLCAQVSRSGLDRCLRRHGVGNLRALLPEQSQERAKGFKPYEPGYVHVDIKYLPQMPDETGCRYLFVAIDRATRWVFVQIKTRVAKPQRMHGPFSKRYTKPARSGSARYSPTTAQSSLTGCLPAASVNPVVSMRLTRHAKSWVSSTV
jgi:hypothetical protein